MSDSYLDPYYEKNFQVVSRHKPGTALYKYNLNKYKLVPENKLIAIQTAENERDLQKQQIKQNEEQEGERIDTHYKKIETDRRKEIDDYFNSLNPLSYVTSGQIWDDNPHQEGLSRGQHFANPQRSYDMGLDYIRHYHNILSHHFSQPYETGYNAWTPNPFVVSDAAINHVVMPIMRTVGEITRPITSAMGNVAQGVAQITPHSGEGYTQPSVVDPIVSDQEPAQEVESVVVHSEARNQGRTIASIESETSNFNQSIENFRQRHNLPSEQTNQRNDLIDLQNRYGPNEGLQNNRYHYNRLGDEGVIPTDPLRDAVLEVHPLGGAYSAAESLLS